MISSTLLDLVQCPDCGSRIDRMDETVRCTGCARTFATAAGYLDLRPLASFTERTKYLDEALHADARHASIAPPLLGSKIRNDMLRKFLALAPHDRVIDLGCGNGRTARWNETSGATIVGIDVSPYFAEEAVERFDMVLGDLRALPFKDGSFTKAWSLDVLEHLSPAALADVLREAHRVLADDAALFVYTHVRKNGWIAVGTRMVNRLARVFERVDLIDLKQERLRKSDHLNPIADHDELREVVGRAGFRIERITYYTPIVGAFVENILARIAERLFARRARNTQPREQHARTGQAPETAAGEDDASLRKARAIAQERMRRGGPMYKLLMAVSTVMKLDVILFGRLRSGPFFALLRKEPGRR